MKELYETLRPKEVRLLHWSAAGAAAALWFSLAWRDAWVLLCLPMLGGWFAFFVYRNRRLDPLGHDGADDDPDFL
jgi:hypothetical protein